MCLDEAERSSDGERRQRGAERSSDGERRQRQRTCARNVGGDLSDVTAAEKNLAKTAGSPVAMAGLAVAGLAVAGPAVAGLVVGLAVAGLVVAGLAVAGLAMVVAELTVASAGLAAVVAGRQRLRRTSATAANSSAVLPHVLSPAGTRAAR